MILERLFWHEMVTNELIFCRLLRFLNCWPRPCIRNF